MQHEIRRRHRQQHAGHAADGERDHERDRPQHRRLKAHAAGVHRQQPVEDFDARRHGDDHRHHAEEAVDVGARPHREEMVQPHHEGQHADRHRRDDHRAVAEQRFAGERRDHLGEDAEGRQDEDIDLRVPPGPNQVDVHHGVAAEVRREEMEAEVAVEQQHREGRRQDREGRDDQQVRGQRRPAEDRHASIGHAGRADFQDRGDEIDAGQQRAHAGDLQRPEIIIDADARRKTQLRQRGIDQPAGLGEFADRQRHVDQKHARSGQPETDRIQRRERHVAHAQLQRHREVHQTDHERHGHEEDHDRAVRGEDLVVVVRRQIARRIQGESLLRAHHDGVGEAAQQHHQRQQAIHHADPLVVDRRHPLAPEIGNPALKGDPCEHAENRDDHPDRRRQRNRLV